LDALRERAVPALQKAAPYRPSAEGERYAVCLSRFETHAEKTVIEDSLQTWQDLRQIDLTRSYEVRDWCKAFGCTKEELHDAVKAVGTSAQKVREYLQK
jgi:hypothetical protein